MEYWGLLLCEFGVLFLTSRFVFASLYFLLARILHHRTLALHIVSLLFLPGVIVHELAHFLVAEVLQVPTGEMEFAPIVHGDSVKLGSVQVAHTDIIRRFLIGVAPVLIGATALCVLVWYASQGFSFTSVVYSSQSIIKYIAIVYGLFVVSNTMFSSSKDMEGAAGFLILAAVAVLASIIFFHPSTVSVMQILQSKKIVMSVQALVYMIAIPVGINILFTMMLRAVLKRG